MHAFKIMHRLKRTWVTKRKSRGPDTRGVPEVFANTKTMEDTVNLDVQLSLEMSYKHCCIKSASCNVPIIPTVKNKPLFRGFQSQSMFAL